MSASPTTAQARAEALAWASASGAQTVTLGGVVFAVHPMPWGVLRSVAAALDGAHKRLHFALEDEHTSDCMSLVVAAGLGLTLSELNQLPANQYELGMAYSALMRATAMESSVKEQAAAVPASKLQQLSPTEQWDALYADIAHFTGWTWAELDAMTFPRLKAMQRAWAAVPPLPLALARIARYLGMPEPKNQAGQGGGAPAPGAAPSSAAEILAAFGGQGMPVMRTRPIDPALDAAGF